MLEVDTMFRPFFTKKMFRTCLEQKKYRNGQNTGMKKVRKPHESKPEERRIHFVWIA
jgi:hypothetical protein